MKNPCHTEQIKSLKRIEGQVRGIQKMIDEGKYCVDILTQLKAVKSATAAVEGKILEKHLHHCIKASIDDAGSMDAKIAELVKILKR
jgi:DNA-binding FrmR family transcriptional regulator